jgi:hypothetical protein
MFTIVLLSAGWETNESAYALRKLPVSATLRKAFRCAGLIAMRMINCLEFKPDDAFRLSLISG